MADKTEQPTPKRLKEARKKGQVAKSNDLTQAFLFMTATGVISAGGSYYVAELLKLIRESFGPERLTGQLPADQVLHVMGAAWSRFLLLSAPLLGALFLGSAAINFLQVKIMFSPEVIKPKFNKLNPIKGIQNLLFKSRTYLELIKNLIKFVVVFFLVYGTLQNSLRDVLLTSRTNLLSSSLLAGQLMFTLLFKVAAVFVIIGAADF